MKMLMLKKSARALGFAASLSVFALAGVLMGAAGPARAGESAACKNAKSEVAEVAAACKRGGQKAAKKIMSRVVKEQKAAGNKINCKSCHGDLKTFATKANAVADLKRYLGG
jgi:cytochrome c